MRKPLASLSRLALVFVSAVVFAAPTAAAQDSIDQEVGVWKMNSEESHWPGVTSPTSRQMTVEKQGREIFENEPGVLKLGTLKASRRGHGYKRKYTTLRIPHSVYIRVKQKRGHRA